MTKDNAGQARSDEHVLMIRIPYGRVQMQEGEGTVL